MVGSWVMKYASISRGDEKLVDNERQVSDAPQPKLNDRNEGRFLNGSYVSGTPRNRTDRYRPAPAIVSSVVRMHSRVVKDHDHQQQDGYESHPSWHGWRIRTMKTSTSLR